MKQKIPVINQKFDLFTFLKVVKKSVWIIILNLILAFIIGFLYLRYTAPVYQSKSVIQVNTQNKTNEILNLDNSYETGLSPVIELMRSKEFLKECFSQMDLDVSYYKQGTFLSHELYKSSPFEVKQQGAGRLLKDVRVYTKFKNNKIIINYETRKGEYEYALEANRWKKIKGGKIKINITDYPKIKKYQDQLKKGGYFFTINSLKHLVNQYSQRLDVKILNKSAGTIEISFSDKNAKKTTELVNKLSEQFLVYEVEKKKESSNKIIDYINKQLRVVSYKLDSTRKKLKKYQDTEVTGVDSDNPFKLQRGNSELAMAMSSASNRIKKYENEIIRLEFEISTLNYISEQIDSKQDVNVFELLALLSGTRSEGFMQSMLKSMQDLYNEKNELLNDVTENNHKIKTVNKQIDTKKKQITNFIKTTIDRLEKSKEKYNENIAQIENNIQTGRTEEGLELTRLQRLFSINQKFYDQLIQKKAEYMISQAGYVSDNIILEKAVVPFDPVKPSKKNIILIVTLLAIFVSLIIIMIRYLFYNKITNVMEVASFTDLKVIGAIPLYHDSSKLSQLLVNKHPKSVLTESFRNIRANMEFLSEDTESAVITISSTVSGEGKTFVSLNLSGILAMADKKVLIMDLDLRKPKLYNIFDLDNNKGVSTILSQKDDYHDCIHKTEIETMDVMGSGPVPPNPSELILKKRFKQLLEDLKKEYDFIVIDTPPIGIVTDAIKSFELSDYAIYITRANQSPRTFISYINSLTESKALKNVRIVLNGIEDSAGKYGYGYGYNYGYSYGYGDHARGYRDYVKSNKYYDEPGKADKKKSNKKFIISDIFKSDKT